jgi:hypothetical protein
VSARGSSSAAPAGRSAIVLASSAASSVAAPTLAGSRSSAGCAPHEESAEGLRSKRGKTFPSAMEILNGTAPGRELAGVLPRGRERETAFNA